uniref:Uncharacterized protein n=1 Tax=Oryza brachyantha TaxID=4533 RepID=J3MRZ6_ORYBR
MVRDIYNLRQIFLQLICKHPRHYLVNHITKTYYGLEISCLVRLFHSWDKSYTMIFFLEK